MNNNEPMRFIAFAAAMAAFLALLASCASEPPVITEGEEELWVIAQEWKTQVAAFPGQQNTGSVERVEGVKCTLRNDKGMWSVVTPANVNVQLSAKPLEVDCTKEGYKPAHARVECRSPRQAATRHRNIETGFTLVLVPLAIAAAPIAPQLAVQAGTQAFVAGVGAVAAHRSIPEGPDVCRYGNVSPTITAK